MEQQKVSLRPDQFAEGGGLLDDFDGVIADIRFVMTNYDGLLSEAVPVCSIRYAVDGDDVGTDLLSVGGKGDFIPDDSGMGLIALKSKTTLTKKSKFGMFMEALVTAGFPLNRMEDEINYLVGLEGHFLRKIVEFRGLAKKKDERDSTVMVCTKIIKLPWDQAIRGKGKKGAAASVAVDAGLADTVAGIIRDVVIGAGGEMAKKDVMSALFKSDAVKGLDDRKGALKLAASDAFLNSRQDDWDYADGALSMMG